MICLRVKSSRQTKNLALVMKNYAARRLILALRKNAQLRKKIDNAKDQKRAENAKIAEIRKAISSKLMTKGSCFSMLANPSTASNGPQKLTSSDTEFCKKLIVTR